MNTMNTIDCRYINDISTTNHIPTIDISTINLNHIYTNTNDTINIISTNDHSTIDVLSISTYSEQSQLGSPLGVPPCRSKLRLASGDWKKF